MLDSYFDQGIIVILEFTGGECVTFGTAENCVYMYNKLSGMGNWKVVLTERVILRYSDKESRGLLLE